MKLNQCATGAAALLVLLCALLLTAMRAGASLSGAFLDSHTNAAQSAVALRLPPFYACNVAASQHARVASGEAEPADVGVAAPSSQAAAPRRVHAPRMCALACVCRAKQQVGVL
jgi:hypothetical protein